jgi:iron complex transport system substrate-binding protein
MMNRVSTHFLRISAFSFLAFTAGSALAQDITAFKDTSRLVVVGGSLTEIVYALGEEGKLVARDTTAVFPEAATKLPDVGYMRALAPEGVLSVNPTALLVIEGSGPPEALDVLSKGSVEYETVPESYSHEGILTKVHAVGKALGVEAKADALAAELDGQLKHAEEATANIAERKRVLFVISAADGKIRASGTDTAAAGIIKLAGAVNAVTAYSGYKELSDEAILDANPDFIVMMDNGGDHTATNEALLSHPTVALTPAGKNKAVLRFDGAKLLGFGPRTPEAVLELAGALYGDQVQAH